VRVPVEGGRKGRGGSRWLRLSLPVLLLVVAGASGIGEVVGGYREAETSGQRFVMAVEIAYAVVGFFALYGLLAGRRWARPAMFLWGALVTLTAAAATVAFGGAGLLAAVAGGVSAAALCALASWLAFPRPGRGSGGKPEPSNEEIP
jgi:hypothetical protein